jgi:leucine dehydrogenase
VTAFGVYMGMKATAKKVFGTDGLANKRVAVQGVGQVGMHLVECLVMEKAKVFVTDLHADKTKGVARQYQVIAVEQEDIYDLDVDIYAPCALGATANDETISRLKCSIIAGAPNNQLKDEIRHGYMLMDRNITYAPDFVINAGGLINVYHEFLRNYNRKRVLEQAEKIYDTCLDIFSFADREVISSQEAGMRLAEKRISEVGRLRMRR